MARLPPSTSPGRVHKHAAHSRAMLCALLAQTDAMGSLGDGKGVAIPSNPEVSWLRASSAAARN